MAAALALGLDLTAHKLASGDLVEQVFWTDRLHRAADMLRAARETKASK